MTYQRMLMIVSLVCFFSLTVSAEFYPNRIYKERKKASLDYGWKFYRNSPTGTPSDSNYNDAGWVTVNIPHSASYDPPTPDGEAQGHQGICWYRKRFSIPSTAKHTGKIFLEFEGAMQSADVYLNGKLLGTHDVFPICSCPRASLPKKLGNCKGPAKMIYSFANLLRCQ